MNIITALKRCTQRIQDQPDQRVDHSRVIIFDEDILCCQTNGDELFLGTGTLVDHHMVHELGFVFKEIVKGSLGYISILGKLVYVYGRQTALLKHLKAFVEQFQSDLIPVFFCEYLRHIGMRHVNTRTLGKKSFMYDLVREA